MVELVFLGINDVGERVYDYLLDRDDADVRALLTHRDQLSLVEELEPDLLVSSGFRYIVPEDILAIPDRGAVNLHNSYLPYNRGANANVWTIINDDPAGATIHYMTPDVDAGPVIDRRKVTVYPDDNAKSLYQRIEQAQFEQFTDVWADIRDSSAQTVELDYSKGSYQYKQDFVDLWELDTEADTTVGELINRLRALTYPPYKNAYFERDGERYYVEIDITPAETVAPAIDGSEEYRELDN